MTPALPPSPVTDLPLFAAAVRAHSRLERAFARFHAENPHILDELERRALALYRAGARRIGIKAIWEAMRYDHAIATRGEDLKLNNSYTAIYARVLLERRAELAEVVETRERRSA